MSEEHHKSTGGGMYAFQICSALTVAALLIISISWASDILIPPAPNQEMAYEIDYPGQELDAARARNVNLAAVQVTWPMGMDSVRKKELLAHNRDMLKHNPSALSKVPYVESASTGPAVARAPVVELPLPNLLASADLARGETVAKKCLSCHTFGNGGKDSTGPNLWNVVGASRAANPSFKYSDAMASFGGAWSLESLNDYLRKPGKYIKGTRMAFAGIRKAEDRANLIAYMRSQSDNPVPLPEIVPVEEPTEEAEEEMVSAELGS
jgi:cytochrome c